MKPVRFDRSLPIATTVKEEVGRQLAFEEDQDIPEVTADDVRFTAIALRARANYCEDDGMVKISVRWCRYIAKALATGASAMEGKR